MSYTWAELLGDEVTEADAAERSGFFGRMRESLAKSLADLGDGPSMRLRLLGMIDYVDDLVAASDLVITKSGGLIVSEVLARGRPMFVSRLVLAATLSGLYGIYSGFELLEHRRLRRSEEYADSEKYEIVVRDWDAPGNLKPLIGALNALRQAWPALGRTETLRFERVKADRILFYRKALPVGQIDLLSEEPKRWRQPVWVAVNVNPTRPEQAVLRPDLAAVGIDPARPYRYRDLLTGAGHARRSRTITVTLGPDRPFVIFTLSQRPAPKGSKVRATRRPRRPRRVAPDRGPEHRVVQRR